MTDATTPRERAARAIYDELEGPIANQDFGRQQRQWALSQTLADAALKAAFSEPSEAMVEAGAKAAFEYREDGRVPILKWKDNSPDAKQFHMANMRAAIRAAIAKAGS